MSAKISRGFASDNNAGIHPELLEAVNKANTGHAIAYGDDPYTIEAIQTIRKYFGDQSEVFFVLTGTGANVLSISSVTRSIHAVICADTAHINTDECGAPEKFTGCKLISVPTSDGKLTTDAIKKNLQGFGFEHHVQPKVISVSQPTEMGTLYTPSEIRDLAALAHEYGMILHMDGARLANAAVALNMDFRTFTVDAGVDVLSFGGTKNGMLFGESVVFFNRNLSVDFKYLRKQSMQLVSKMRYIGAQFSAYLNNDLWRKNAENANRMALALLARIKDCPGITITQKVEANAVFAIIPQNIIEPLQEKYFFYVWDEHKNEVRWMTSWDTTLEDIEDFSNCLLDLLNQNR